MMAAEASKPVLQTVGNYDLLEKIAEGGMGTVYKGRNRTTGDVVAVKLVSPQMASNPVFLQRFEKEYNVARSLDHPNIVRALDFGTAGGRSFLVMEFIDGESLGQRLERDGKLPEAEAIRLISLAAEGLQNAHKQGLIHRDVKPDNIMVTPEGRVKLADLGLVKEMDADINLTRTGRGLGTPHFMAPEQFKNAKNADVRCDIYSLGATLYMMVTGQMPFQSCGPLDAFMKKINNELSAPRKLNPELSDRINAAILRAMSADPEQRPATCQEFIDDLNGVGTRKTPAAKSDGSGLELWYLIYKDEEGEPHMVKGSVKGIRSSLKEGLLGDASNVKAGRSKTGTFRPLRSYPEFRDLVPGAGTPAGGEKPARSTAVTSAPKKAAGPHIPLEKGDSASLEWIKLLVLIALAVGAGVVVAFLLHGG
jgi:serine/threonine protein kinase